MISGLSHQALDIMVVLLLRESIKTKSRHCKGPKLTLQQVGDMVQAIMKTIVQVQVPLESGWIAIDVLDTLVHQTLESEALHCKASGITNDA